MCIATSTAATVASIVAAVISSTVGTVTAVQSANAQKATYEYQAQENRKNAKIAEANAAQERQSGLEEARKQRLKTLQNIGSQQSAMAANGLDISSGTPLDVIEDTARAGELDALMIEYNSERTAQNYERQADNFNNQANLDLISGKNAQKAGYYNAANSFVNSVSDFDYDGIKGLSLKSDKVSPKWKRYSGGLLDNGSRNYFA